ncbi:MAG TPA: 2-C-methyl-D-erythritol 2,4-cyclodiphosphate synthase [Phycisphaerae bacterium]|nr:2-C-methyl-D-erythritol 2,4-cyclodiphosphate synthase [Phycisphaerae bacterium]HDZ42695.1 2-C-methyl-D-erythritol 2,4-cyclodiphosphate synthase [Phycisphaerae bacterium]
MGYDSHRFVEGRPLVLGGVRIDHPLGLGGHSDGDAVLHAVTDAVLGAIGADDIGQLFPDNDPKYAGADSAQFVRRAVALAGEKGYRAANCDVTVIAEAPRLAEHKAAMRQTLAALLDLPSDAVAVKAKTNETMGAIGRGEGIAVMAVVMLTQAS